MQRGFIQIPVLLLILIGTAVFGGTSYVAYEVGQKSSGKTNQPNIVDSAQTATTSSASTAIAEVGKKEDKSTEQSSMIASLKKEVANLTQGVNLTSESSKQEVPKTTTTSLPSGAIVEIDANGNIIRTIKEAVQQVNTLPAQTSQTQNPTTAGIQISRVTVTPTMNSVRIEWQTNKPTESKVFISGGGFSSKVYNSESGKSTKHSATIFTLTESTKYTFEIEAVSGESGVAESIGDFITQGQISSKMNVYAWGDKRTIEDSTDSVFIAAGGGCETKYMEVEVLNQKGENMSDEDVTVSVDGASITKKTNETVNNNHLGARFWFTPQSTSTTVTMTFTSSRFTAKKDIKIGNLMGELPMDRLRQLDNGKWMDRGSGMIVDLETRKCETTSSLLR